MNAFIRKVAFRYLRPKGKEGFISIIAGFSFLGIMLGVATLIVVMSVMNGFRAELMKSILGFNGHIAVGSAISEGMLNYDKATELVRAIPGITSATPLIERQAMLAHDNNAMGINVHGVKLEDLKDRDLIASKIVMGSLDKFTEDNAIVIGLRLAERLNVVPGDIVTLIAPEGNSSPFGTVPRMRTLQVAAIFNVGMTEFDKGMTFIPLTTAQKFFRMPNMASGLEIFVDDPDKVTLYVQKIFETLGANLRILDWQKANSKFFGAIKVERNVMFLILTLIIIVAAFNIISSLIMLVKDKGRDIAILRTMGATKGMITGIFLLTGSMIGVAGTIMGSALGITFALNIERIRQFFQSLTGTELFNAEIYFLSKMPSKIDWSEVSVVVGMALTITFLATLRPAWRAAKLDPVEALRYE
jgi:lipoprotein-releasing system permease protein|nr:lipoprotein-releasing ABC transporter permease subunit [Candidatus Nucleicultrix amoebiphila]